MALSEAQKSLASITSLMSSDLRRIRARQRTRRQSQVPTCICCQQAATEMQCSSMLRL